MTGWRIGPSGPGEQPVNPSRFLQGLPRPGQEQILMRPELIGMRCRDRSGATAIEEPGTVFLRVAGFLLPGSFLSAAI